MKVLILALLVASACAAPAMPAAPATPAAGTVNGAVLPGGAQPQAPTPMMPVDPTMAAQAAPYGIVNQATVGGCGPNCNGQPTWLMCAVNIEVGSSTNPGIGNEGWWTQNYPIMTEFFKRCSTPETINSIKLQGVPGLNQFALPKNQPIAFQISAQKIPFAFLPFMASEVQNLPGESARFSATLTCHKTWTTQSINLKSCVVTNTNRIMLKE